MHVVASTPNEGACSAFEESYLVRTLGRIAEDAEIALTELVANAWDAGASRVDLTIPAHPEGRLIVEDDGHGMTAVQFRERWMMLGYDRLKHQPAAVEFPPDRIDWQRLAHGRNGIGRHGLLCFGDRYVVETWRDGHGARFEVDTQGHERPIRIDRASTFPVPGHGTRLSVDVRRHCPDANDLLAMLALRFLPTDRFQVRVNGRLAALVARSCVIRCATLDIPGGAGVAVNVMDESQVPASLRQQGIGFWVNGRRVGTPGWWVGAESVMDGGGRFAERYSFAVHAGDEWSAEVSPDWSGFRSSQRVQALHEAVRSHARAVAAQLSGALIEESSEEALVRNRQAFGALSPLGRAEIATFVRDLAKTMPSASQEVLSAAVHAAIKLERARGGAVLLERLTTLDESDIDGLNRLLSQWTVREALTVLDEIDHRMTVIATIEKLSADPGTDELHTLHPLVTQARWLFGPEFDSTEYASNVSLRTAAETIFKKRLAPDAFDFRRRRPDLLLLADATCSIVGAEGFDPVEDALTKHRHVLIVELKRGGHEVGRDDVRQANNYVQDFYFSGAMDGPTQLTAFVVGHTIAATAGRELQFIDGGLPRARIRAVTYGQLTRSAHRRLLCLKDRIPARYDEITGADLSAKVLKTAARTHLHLVEGNDD